MKVKMNKEDYENPQKVGEGIDETFLENINAEMQKNAEFLQVSSFLVGNKNLQRAFKELTSLYNDISNFYNDVSKIIDIKPEIRSLLEEIEKQYIDLQKLFSINGSFEKELSKPIYPESYHILNSKLTYNLFNSKDFSLNNFLDSVNNPFVFINKENEQCIGVVKFASEEDKVFFENNKAFIGCIIRTISGLFYKEEKSLLEKNCITFQEEERPRFLLTELWKYIVNDKDARLDKAPKLEEYLEECIKVMIRTKIVVCSTTNKNATGDNEKAQIEERDFLPLKPYISISAKNTLRKAFKLTEISIINQLGLIKNHYYISDFKDRNASYTLKTINQITLSFGICNFLSTCNPNKTPKVSLSLNTLYKENLNDYEKAIRRPGELRKELERVLKSLKAKGIIYDYEINPSKNDKKNNIIDFYFYDEIKTKEIKDKSSKEKEEKKAIDTISKKVEANIQKKKKYSSKNI